MHNEGRHLNDADKMQDSKDHSKPSRSDLNLGRRRMIRSAAAVAPLVLTLRSGGVLAAASCTGAKALGATTNGSGKITLTGGSAAVGDTCVINYQVCESSTTKISSGTVAGQVTLDNSGALVCADANAKNKPAVAILSSMSATSLTG
jgi:hypothetical protein